MISRLVIAFVLSTVAVPIAAAEPAPEAIIYLRKSGPSITPGQAKELSPQELGEVLLAPGHPIVSEAVVGREGMEPPPPPGMPVVTRVKLYLQPIRSGEPGFCQRTIATIYLEPVERLADGRLPASRPDSLSTEVAYRWIGDAGDTAACEAPRYQFFSPRPDEVEQALEAVRLLASANEAAKNALPLSFTLSVRDEMGPELLAAHLNNPEIFPDIDVEIITDPIEALASLPIDSVTFAGPAARASPNVLSESDITNVEGGSLEPVTLFLGGVWTVGLVIDDFQVAVIRLLRRIPPPF